MDKGWRILKACKQPGHPICELHIQGDPDSGSQNTGKSNRRSLLSPTAELSTPTWVCITKYLHVCFHKHRHTVAHNEVTLR